jgi:hypothetical protein
MLNTLKSDTGLGVMALLVIVAMAFIAAYYKVDVDAGIIAGTAVTAIAAFVRGDRPKEEPKP